MRVRDYLAVTVKDVQRREPKESKMIYNDESLKTRHKLQRYFGDRDYPSGFIIFSAATLIAALALLVFPYGFVAFGRAAVNFAAGNRYSLTISDTCVERRPINGANYTIDRCNGTIKPYDRND